MTQKWQFFHLNQIIIYVYLVIDIVTLKYLSLSMHACECVRVCVQPFGDFLCTKTLFKCHYNSFQRKSLHKKHILTYTLGF